jgi:hypothetical protein
LSACAEFEGGFIIIWWCWWCNEEGFELLRIQDGEWTNEEDATIELMRQRQTQTMEKEELLKFIAPTSYFVMGARNFRA